MTGENDDKAVVFSLMGDGKDSTVFENKAHDFPQRIKYYQPSPDSLYASIEGLKNGVFKKQEFRMIKSKSR